MRKSTIFDEWLPKTTRLAIKEAVSMMLDVNGPEKTLHYLLNAEEWTHNPYAREALDYQLIRVLNLMVKKS